METKWCYVCERHKDLKEFGGNAARRDGRQVECRECKRKRREGQEGSASGLLAAMRRALKTKDQNGGSMEVKTYRQLLRENPERFMSRLEKLEAAHQASKGKGTAAGGAGSSQKDEGEERVLELVDRLLKEIGVQP